MSRRSRRWCASRERGCILDADPLRERIGMPMRELPFGSIAAIDQRDAQAPSPARAIRRLRRSRARSARAPPCRPSRRPAPARRRGGRCEEAPDLLPARARAALPCVGLPPNGDISVKSSRERDQIVVGLTSPRSSAAFDSSESRMSSATCGFARRRCVGRGRKCRQRRRPRARRRELIVVSGS